eukprot:COSAG01_NODE_645_length_14553_cov_32.925227_9_plen_219_part_00
MPAAMQSRKRPYEGADGHYHDGCQHRQHGDRDGRRGSAAVGGGGGRHRSSSSSTHAAAYHPRRDHRQSSSSSSSSRYTRRRTDSDGHRGSSSRGQHPRGRAHDGFGAGNTAASSRDQELHSVLSLCSGAEEAQGLGPRIREAFVVRGAALSALHCPCWLLLHTVTCPHSHLLCCDACACDYVTAGSPWHQAREEMVPQGGVQLQRVPIPLALRGAGET